MLVALVAVPLTQTMYGMILMRGIADVVARGQFMWSLGALCGITMGLSALMQGRAVATAADAMGETDSKGFGHYVVVIAILVIIEMVAVLALVFTKAVLNRMG